MRKFVILACLVSVCLSQQVQFACIGNKVLVCNTFLNGDVISAANDQAEICSAVDAYKDCLGNIKTVCRLHNTKPVKMMEVILDITKSYKCGASGSVYSTVAIVVGICLQRLF